jgi:hypothetical protein
MIRVQVFMPLDRFACAHSARKNQYCHFRTMTYRLENRGGRFSWKARGSSLMSSHASRTRRDRIALDTIEDLGQRDDVKRLDPMGHRRLGQPDRSDVILKRTGEGSPQRIQGYHPSSKSCSYQCNNAGANTIDRPLYVKISYWLRDLQRALTWLGGLATTLAYILTGNFPSDGRQCNFVELNSKKLPPQQGALTIACGSKLRSNENRRTDWENSP